MTMLLGEKIRFQALVVNGTAGSTGTWTVSPSGPSIGTPTSVSGGVEATFEPSTAGTFTLSCLLPLLDGQRRMYKWDIVVT